MKVLSATLALLAVVCLGGCQTAGSDRRDDFARSWETPVTVELEVVGYEPGAPDSSLAATWGTFDALKYPANLSKVRILPPSEFAGQEYAVSIPDSPDRGFDPGPWREVGNRFQVALSLVHLKYRPWNFVPFDSIKPSDQMVQPQQ